MSTLRLQFIIDAIDNATGKVRAVNEQIERANAPMRRLRAAARELVNEAGWSKLQGQMAGIRDRASSLMGTLQGITGALGAVGLAAGGAFFAVKRTVDEIDEVNDTAKKLGMTTEQLSRLQYAAQLAGSSGEEMGNALRFLSDNMADARKGSKDALAQFGLLGIGMQQLRTMSPVDVLERMAQVYQEVGNEGQNAQLKISNSQALMGKGGAQMIQLLNGGLSALKDAYKESDSTGATISTRTAENLGQIDDGFNKLMPTLRGLRARIAEAAGPAMTRLIDKLTALSAAGQGEWADRFGEKLGRVFDALPGFMTGIAQIGAGIARVLGWMDSFAEAIGGWDRVITGVAVLIGSTLVVKIIGLVSAIAGALPTIWGLVKWGGAFASGLVPALAFLGKLGALFLAAAGWPVALGLALGAAAIAVIKYWEPIKTFFSDLWDKITAITGIRGIGSMFGGGAGTAASAVPSAVPLGAGRSVLDGQIRVFVDSQGNGRVTDVRQVNSGASNVNLQAGYMGAGMALP